MPEVCTECGEVPRGPLCSKGRNAGFPHQVAASTHHHHASSRSRGRSPDAIRSKSPPSPSSRRGGGVPSFVKHPPGSGHHLPSPAAASQAGSAYPQPPPSLRSSSRRKRSRSRRSRSRSGSRSGRSGRSGAGGSRRRRRRSSSRRSRSAGAGGRSSGGSSTGSSTRRSRSRRSGSRRSHGSRRSQSPRGHHHSYAKSPTSPPLVGTVKWQPGGSGGAPPSALHHHDPVSASPSTPGFRSAYDRVGSGGAGTFGGGGENFGSTTTTTAPPRIWVGASVERNPGYWEAGNQDGGAGNRGTVVDCGELWVKVRWHNAGEGTHRWGADGAFDVSIVSDVAPPADDVVQRETTGSRQIVQSVGARDRYSATPSHGGSAGAGHLPMPVALPPSQHAAAVAGTSAYLSQQAQECEASKVFCRVRVDGMRSTAPKLHYKIHLSSPFSQLLGELFSQLSELAPPEWLLFWETKEGRRVGLASEDTPLQVGMQPGLHNLHQLTLTQRGKEVEWQSPARSVPAQQSVAEPLHSMNLSAIPPMNITGTPSRHRPLLEYAQPVALDGPTSPGFARDLESMEAQQHPHRDSADQRVSWLEEENRRLRNQISAASPPSPHHMPDAESPQQRYAHGGPPPPPAQQQQQQAPYPRRLQNPPYNPPFSAAQAPASSSVWSGSSTATPARPALPLQPPGSHPESLVNQRAVSPARELGGDHGHGPPSDDATVRSSYLRLQDVFRSYQRFSQGHGSKGSEADRMVAFVASSGVVHQNNIPESSIARIVTRLMGTSEKRPPLSFDEFADAMHLVGTVCCLALFPPSL